MNKSNNTSIDFSHTYKLLKMKFPSIVEENKPMAPFTTFGTGGAARLFADVSTVNELAEVIKSANELSLPIFMLGGGSNLLVSDSGYEGLVIKNSIKGIELKGRELSCGAGVDLQDLIDFATENSLTGLEFATGIWGTVGGAIYGNAGAYGGEVKDILVSVELVDRQGNIKTEPASSLEFDYRWSRLKKTGEFVARAKFALELGKKDLIKKRCDEIMSMRGDKLPSGTRSAGCYFKNILDEREKFGKLPAGKLLEDIGAKKISFGDASVFENHANIIINKGKAKSSDIRKLAAILKNKVKDKFNIDLTEEVILLGDFEEESL